MILSQSTIDRSLLNRTEEKSEKSRFFVVVLLATFSLPEVKMQTERNDQKRQ